MYAHSQLIWVGPVPSEAEGIPCLSIVPEPFRFENSLSRVCSVVRSFRLRQHAIVGGAGVYASIAHQAANITRSPALLLEPQLLPFSSDAPLALFGNYDIMERVERGLEPPNAPRWIRYNIEDPNLQWTSMFLNGALAAQTLVSQGHVKDGFTRLSSLSDVF